MKRYCKLNLCHSTKSKQQTTKVTHSYQHLSVTLTYTLLGPENLVSFSNDKREIIFKNQLIELENLCTSYSKNINTK